MYRAFFMNSLGLDDRVEVISSV